VICVDTSVLIDLLRGNEAVTTHLAGTDRERGLCYPVACELYKGVYKSAKPISRRPDSES
jgi:predicted nucleic acid-binding protein